MRQVRSLTAPLIMQTITDHQLSSSDTSQLDALFRIAFNGFGFYESPRAEIRVIEKQDQQIIAHAAATFREINLSSSKVKVALLGLVCVHPHHRGNRLGHRIVSELHQRINLPFMLNCGSGLVKYYASIGYIHIADQAAYFRDDKLSIDNDPVMLFPNEHDISTAWCEQPIFFGKDF